MRAHTHTPPRKATICQNTSVGKALTLTSQQRTTKAEKVKKAEVTKNPQLPGDGAWARTRREEAAKKTRGSRRGCPSAPLSGLGDAPQERGKLLGCF